MFWIISSIVVFVAFVGAVVAFFVYDRRFEKKSALETMKKETFDEIAAEREQELEKAKKFKEILKKTADPTLRA